MATEVDPGRPTVEVAAVSNKLMAVESLVGCVSKNNCDPHEKIRKDTPTPIEPQLVNGLSDESSKDSGVDADSPINKGTGMQEDQNKEVEEKPLAYDTPENVEEKKTKEPTDDNAQAESSPRKRKLDEQKVNGDVPKCTSEKSNEKCQIPDSGESCKKKPKKITSKPFKKKEESDGETTANPTLIKTKRKYVKKKKNDKAEEYLGNDNTISKDKLTNAKKKDNNSPAGPGRKKENKKTLEKRTDSKVDGKKESVSKNVVTELKKNASDKEPCIAVKPVPDEEHQSEEKIDNSTNGDLENEMDKPRKKYARKKRKNSAEDLNEKDDESDVSNNIEKPKRRIGKKGAKKEAVTKFGKSDDMPSAQSPTKKNIHTDAKETEVSSETNDTEVAIEPKKVKRKYTKKNQKVLDKRSESSKVASEPDSVESKLNSDIGSAPLSSTDDKIVEEKNDGSPVQEKVASPNDEAVGMLTPETDLTSKVKIDGDKELKGHFPCPECEYAGKNKAGMLKHLKNHHGIFKCSHCEFLSKTKEGMDEHMKEKHPTSKWGKRKCSKCFRFLNPEDFDKHEESCDGKPIPFACPQCKKEYKFKTLLNHHMKSHQAVEEREFACDECEFRAAYYRNLEKHMDNVHNENRERIHPCADCGKLFFKPEHAQKHRSMNCIVTPENHVCTQCSKTFKSANAVKRHLLTHSDERTVPCDLDGCTMLFKTKRLLTYHKKEVHGLQTKKYKCTYEGCEQKFYKESLLKRHSVTHTG